MAKSKRTPLRDMFADYLQTQLRAEHRPELHARFDCWKVSQEKTFTMYDWLGHAVYTESKLVVTYVWLTPKGKVKFTFYPMCDENYLISSDIEHSMKQWVWKEYFGLTH